MEPKSPADSQTGTHMSLPTETKTTWISIWGVDLQPGDIGLIGMELTTIDTFVN